MRLLPIALYAALIASSAAAGELPIRPDPRLTPGAVATTDVATVCRPGYSKSVRHTSGKLKAFVYSEYEIDRRSGHFEVDHLIPLGIGGADTAENLWPQSRDTQPWNAIAKDKLEDRLHVLVCSGRVPIEEAQHAIATDWIAAYGKYLGSR